MPQPSDLLQPLRRVRQVRQFTEEPLTDAEVDAIVDVGRWSGSSRNSQPWRFVVIRDTATITRIGEMGAPHTRALATAQAAIAVVLPADPEHGVSLAFDDGRASERMLVAANLLGLAAAIAWLPLGVRPSVAELLGIPADRVGAHDPGPRASGTRRARAQEPRGSGPSAALGDGDVGTLART